MSGDPGSPNHETDATITAPASPRLPRGEDVERVGALLSARPEVSRDPGMTVGATARTVLSRRGDESLRLRPITLKEQGDKAHEADFEIVKVLGSGGMGVVYLAWQPALRREVAIKTVPPDADGAVEAAALVEEAVFTGGLEHPNIVPVHALGRHADGRPVLVMKRVAGVSWAQLQQDAEHPAWRPLPTDRLAFHLNVLVQVSNALHFAHSRGVVHRDLKPENVMIGEFGEVYLLDWGIAWRVDGSVPPSRDIVGTLASMAPEMLLGSGEHITPRTDVYLLGAALHRVLVGGAKHGGKTLAEVIASVAASEPVTYPPSVPRELATACNRATARDPDARYATAQEFREALEDFLQHRSSRQLVEQTALRVEVLRELARPAQGPVDATRARQVFAECRFGLQQALRAWADNPEALAMLREATGHICEVELDQRNLAGVEALLAELADPPEHVLKRCDVLRREIQDERARLERLQNIEHEMDHRVSRRQRLFGTLAAGVVNAGVMGTFAWLDHTRRVTLSYGTVYLSLVGLSLAACVLAFWFRAALLRTRFNRALIGTLPVAVVAVFVATLWAQRVGLPPRDAVLLVALGIGFVQATIGVLTLRPFLWSAFGYLAAAVLGSAWPTGAIGAVAVAVLFSHALMGWGWSRE